jgi:hypothetical protein
MAVNNLLLDAFLGGGTLQDVGGKDTTGLDRFVAGNLYAGIMGPPGPADATTLEIGVTMQSVTVARQLSTQMEVAVVMQSATYSILNVAATFEIGVMAAHSVTVKGASSSLLGELPVVMQSSTRKFVPGDFVPGGMSLLGVGL